MTRVWSSTEALVIGSTFMTDLGSLFPARLRLTGDKLEFVFVLPDDHSTGRALGPEPPDHRLLELVERIRPRYGTDTADRTVRFQVDRSGQCARLHLELVGIAVRALVVTPDEITAQSLNAPFLGRWQEQIPVRVRMALEEIARILARCRHQAGSGEPLIDLELAYLPHRDHAAQLAVAHEEVRGFIAPVRPVLRMRWHSVTAAQRKAFIDNLANVTGTGWWPRRRLTARIPGLELELPTWVAPRPRAEPDPAGDLITEHRAGTDRWPSELL